MLSRIKSLASLLCALGVAPALPAQDTTLAGWTFSQFIFAPSYPSVDGSTGDPASFVAATFRGAYDPVLAQVDGTITVQTGATGFVDTRFGSWSWGDFDFAGGLEVLAGTDGNTQTTNHITLDGKRMSDTDSAGMYVTFNRANTLWTLTVAATAGYANASGADFTYAARGNGGVATVEWLFNGVVFATQTIAPGPFFAAYAQELPAAFYGNGVIQGRLVAGSVSFDNVQINGRLGTPPTFTTQPAGLVRLVGESAAFTAVATGVTSPTYQWFRGASPIAQATSASYTIESVTLASAGSYRVRVTSANGLFADSEFAVLEVRQAPALTRQPAAQIVNPGQTVSFAVVATGTPAPAFRWQRDGVDLVDGGRISGAATATLVLTGVEEADEGDYRVVVTNAVTSVVSDVAALGVTDLSLPPAVSTAPVDTTAIVGETVEFAVVAGGAPAPSFQWFFNDEPLVDGPGVSGATSDKLVLAALTAQRAGTYRVVISNEAGTETREAVLTVQAPPAVVSGPGPASRTVVAGSAVAFQIVATGSPAPTFQWLRDGEDIVGQTTDTLVLSGVTEADVGDYSVRIANPAGTLVSPVSRLAVGRAALITTPPASTLVALGASATLRVVAVGNPAPTYRWFRNGEQIDDADGPVLTLASVTAADAGDYTVRVANEFASEDSPPARLRVAREVTIFSPRQVQVFPPGATLSIGAPDTQVSPDLRYVWYRDGRVVPGASGAVLFLESASFADSGVYTLRIYGAKNRLLGTRTIARVRVSIANGYDLVLREPGTGRAAGTLVLDVADRGAFSGRLNRADGTSHAFRGVFAFPGRPDFGVATVNIARRGLPPLAVSLSLEAAASGLDATAAGTVGSASAPRLKAPAAWAGVYRLALDPAGEAPPFVLDAKIDARGVLRLTGVLPDRTKLTGSFPSSVDASYAVLARPYRSIAGVVSGGLGLQASPAGYFADEASSGSWLWFRAATGALPVVLSELEPALAP